MKTLLLIAALTATLPAYADEYGRLQAEINQMREQQYQMESQQAIQRNQQIIDNNYRESQQYERSSGYPPSVQERYGREYEIMPGQAPGQDSYQYQLRD